MWIVFDSQSQIVRACSTVPLHSEPKHVDNTLLGQNRPVCLAHLLKPEGTLVYFANQLLEVYKCTDRLGYQLHLQGNNSTSLLDPTIRR